MAQNNPNNLPAKKESNRKAPAKHQEPSWDGIVNGPNGKWVIVGMTVVAIGVLIVVDRKVVPGSKITVDMFRGGLHLEAAAA